MPQPSARASAPSMLISAAAFVVVVAGMRAAQPLVVPFLLAVFISILSAPALLWLEARHIPRPLALLVVIAAIIAAGFALTALVGTSLADFSRNLPQYKSRLVGQAGAAIAWLQGHGVELSQERALAFVDPGRAMQLVADVFRGFQGLLAQAFLILLMVVFILLEASSVPRKLRAVVADPERELANFEAFSANLKRYLAIKSAASIATGVVIAGLLSLIGVGYPALWGLLAFLLNYVPSIGSIIAAVPAVLFALVDLGPEGALWALAAYAAVNIVIGSVIEPRFMGRGLGLSPLVVFLSLVFWGWVLGLVGMFLSVPLTMTVQIALGSRPATRWIAVLLGPASVAGSEVAGSQHETPEPRGADHGDEPG